MVRTLLERPELDAVLAVKRRSAGGPLLRLARRIDYRAPGLSSPRPMVPSGFHGFGCYLQAERLRGASSYRGWGYWPEPLRALVSGDAAASPLALTIGIGGPWAGGAGGAVPAGECAARQQRLRRWRCSATGLTAPL